MTIFTQYIFKHFASPTPALTETKRSVVREIGFGLMTHYLLPFELIAILLLVVLVGTVYYASRKIKP